MRDKRLVGAAAAAAKGVEPENHREKEENIEEKKGIV